MQTSPGEFFQETSNQITTNDSSDPSISSSSLDGNLERTESTATTLSTPVFASTPRTELPAHCLANSFSSFDPKSKDFQLTWGTDPPFPLEHDFSGEDSFTYNASWGSWVNGDEQGDEYIPLER